MIRLLGLLLLLTITQIDGKATRQSDKNEVNSGITGAIIYTSFNKSISSNITKTIIHSTDLKTDLNHLVVDRNTGRVTIQRMLAHHSIGAFLILHFIFHSNAQIFIGGRNRLFQLSPDLDIVETAITGPKNDSKDCSFYECTQNVTRKSTDNVNKVLLIDYSTSRLITCGSLFQGICSVRSLQNVSQVEQEVLEAVVANNESKCSIRI